MSLTELLSMMKHQPLVNNIGYFMSHYPKNDTQELIKLLTGKVQFTFGKP